jgi:hypothetical protein
VFVQNGARHSHGLADPNLSLTAWRAATIVNSLLRKEVYRLDPEEGVVAERAATSLRNNNRFLAWSASRRELYVAADNGGSIEVLAARPLRKVASIREGVGWNATSVAMSPDGATLYAIFTTRSREPDGPSNCRLALHARNLLLRSAVATRSATAPALGSSR